MVSKILTLNCSFGPLGRAGPGDDLVAPIAGVRAGLALRDCLSVGPEAENTRGA